MPKFGCRCGYVMVFQTGEEPYDLALLPEKDIGDVISELNNNEKLSADDFIEIIDSQRLGVMRCPQCGRLWVEEGIRQGKFISFIKEDKEV